MLFRRLLDSYRAAAATRTAAEGFAVSAAAHFVLVAGTVLLTHETLPNPEPSATFTPVKYLIPADRLAGSRPQQEKIAWTTLGTEGEGLGYSEEKKDEPRDDKLEIVVQKGDSVEQELAREEFESRPPISLGDSIMTELQVDSAVVRYEDSAAPPYPESMLRRRVEGVVLVQYVVDSMGRADTSTFRVLSSTHPDFARSVKNTLPRMRFRPAVMANRRVSQLVQQPFAFRIIDTTTVSESSKRPPRP